MPSVRSKRAPLGATMSSGRGRAWARAWASGSMWKVRISDG